MDITVPTQTIATIRRHLALSLSHPPAKPGWNKWKKVAGRIRRPGNASCFTFARANKSALFILQPVKLSSAQLSSATRAATRASGPTRRATINYEESMAAVPSAPIASPCHTAHHRAAGRPLSSACSRNYTALATQPLPLPTITFPKYAQALIYGKRRQTQCTVYLRDTSAGDYVGFRILDVLHIPTLSS